MRNDDLWERWAGSLTERAFLENEPPRRHIETAIRKAVMALNDCWSPEDRADDPEEIVDSLCRHFETLFDVDRMDTVAKALKNDSAD